MLRKALWLVFSLFPLISAAAIIGAHDQPVWKLFVSIGMPVALVEGLRSHWWTMFVGLVAAHYGFFVLHPFFNRTLGGWKAKCAWAAANFLFYPITPIIYAVLGIGDAHRVQTLSRARPSKTALARRPGR